MFSNLILYLCTWVKEDPKGARPFPRTLSFNIMLKSKFVASEIAKDATLCTQLERLNEFRTQLVAEELNAYNGNAALKAARAALDEAREQCKRRIRE